MAKLKLGVLGSGKGSNFRAIADAIARGELDAEVCIVISDIADAGILTLARERAPPSLPCGQPCSAMRARTSSCSQATCAW